MKTLAFSLFALACLVPGCASLTGTGSPPLPESFCGTWTCADTTAEYSITNTNDRPTIAAWSSVTGEEYKITDVNYDGVALHAVFKLPSSGHVTRSAITQTGANSLRESCTGDWTGTLDWTRRGGPPQRYFGLD